MMHTCACCQVLEAEKETTPKIEAKAQQVKDKTKDFREEVKEKTKDFREEVGASAKEAVGSAKEAQKDASAQVKDAVNVAQDTIDLVSPLLLHSRVACELGEKMSSRYDAGQPWRR